MKVTKWLVLFTVSVAANLIAQSPLSYADQSWVAQCRELQFWFNSKGKPEGVVRIPESKPVPLTVEAKLDEVDPNFIVFEFKGKEFYWGSCSSIIRISCVREAMFYSGTVKFNVAEPRHSEFVKYDLDYYPDYQSKHALYDHMDLKGRVKCSLNQL